MCDTNRQHKVAEELNRKTSAIFTYSSSLTEAFSLSETLGQKCDADLQVLKNNVHSMT